MPHYEAEAALRRSLIAVLAQTYPSALTEVVVVDDGSNPRLDAKTVEDLGPVTVICRPDEGFRLASARNDGAAASRGDVLVFLDGDMIADPAWLEQHLRWHHTVDDALVIGFRDHIDVEWLDDDLVRTAATAGGLSAALGDRKVERPEWIEFHMRRTGDLTSPDDDLFRVVTGGNLSMRRHLFDRLGGFNDSFTRWGGEDTELGWRAWISGALFIPERGAHCWHQGLGAAPDAEERVSQERQLRKLAHLIPHPAIRKAAPGRIWERPRIVAEVADGPAAEVAATVAALLRSEDIAVTVAGEAASDLIDDFGPDPRVHLGVEAREASPFSPLTARAPAGLAPEPDLMERLAKLALETGEARSADGIRMVSTRRRTRAGSATEMDGGSRRLGRRSKTSRLIARVKRIRSWSDLGAACRWVAAALWRRLDRRRAAPPVVARPLRPDLWAFVDAPGLPTLRGGASTGGRVDLTVTVADEDAGPGPTLSLEGRDDADLLAYPPLRPETALAVLQGRDSVPGPLESMLGGMPPEERPPGPSTAKAHNTLVNRPVDEAALERVRRSVLSEHLSTYRLDRLRRAAGLPSSLPRVSIVLCTRRTERALRVVESMARQTYPELELIVVGHGVEVGSLRTAMSGLPIPSAAIPVDGAVVFGAALATGFREASGSLIAKVDDDDLYATCHIEDLANAWMLSSADLVGKAAEFVLFERSGETIRRFAGGGYSESRTVAGGALAVTRGAYEAAGGWRPLPQRVDKALINDVADMGGTIFRTHGLGYVLVRHGGNTWRVGDQGLRDQAEERWSELPPWVLDSLID